MIAAPRSWEQPKGWCVSERRKTFPKDWSASRFCTRIVRLWYTLAPDKILFNTSERLTAYNEDNLRILLKMDTQTGQQPRATAVGFTPVTLWPADAYLLSSNSFNVIQMRFSGFATSFLNSAVVNVALSFPCITSQQALITACSSDLIQLAQSSVTGLQQYRNQELV